MLDTTDDTFSGDMVRSLGAQKESVGVLISDNVTGTVFRVGSKYVMTAWHLVTYIIDPSKSNNYDYSKLEDESVFVHFNENPQQQAVRVYRVKRIPAFKDESLDVVVLEIANPANMPSPLVLCKTNIEQIGWPEVSFIGYGSPQCQKKFLDPRCQIVSWYSNDKNPGLVDLAYSGYDNPSKIMFTCNMEPGASGSPALTTKDPRNLMVVGVITEGLSNLALPQFPKQYRFAMGARMEYVYTSMCNSNPMLAHELFRESDDKVPKEIETLNPLMIAIYRKALRDGKEKQNTIRVMVVGNYDAGKSTLIKNLLRMSVDDIKSTNGIDIYYGSAPPNGMWERKVTCDDNENIERLARLASSTAAPSSVLSSAADQSKVKPDQFNVSETKNSDDVNKATDVSVIDVASNSERNVQDDNTRGVEDKAKADIANENTDGCKASKENVLQFTSCYQKRDGLNRNKPINIWDFGGQFIFYATHQLFHTRKAVYLLVLDLSKSLDELVEDTDFPECSNKKDVKSFCNFWMHSIHSFVGTVDGEPPVILVGTKMDKCESGTEEHFAKVRELFAKTQLLKHIQETDFHIDNFSTSKSSIDALRSYIIDVAERQKSWNDEIPARWIPLEDSLIKRKRDHQHVTFEEVCKINKENDLPIEDEQEIRLFLTYHHMIGTFVYFDEKGISEFVVLDPQWIVDAFKCIITSKQFCKKRQELSSLWEKLGKEAKLDPKLIDEVWKTENDFFEHKEILLEYLNKLRIVTKASISNVDTKQQHELEDYIVPSLLRWHSSKSDVLDDFLRSRKSTVTCLVFAFENEYMSPTLYQRVTASALGEWSVIEWNGTLLLFEKYGVYELDMQHAGIIEVTDTTIDIMVVNLCDNVSPELTCKQSDKLRRLVEMVLKKEFERFDTKKERQYKLHVRCNIGNKRGKKTKKLDDLKAHRNQTVACPDKEKCHDIDVDAVFCQWFPDEKKTAATGNVATTIVDRLERENSKTLEGKLTKHVALKLSGINEIEWDVLGRSLGISDTEIQSIKRKYQKERSQNFHMLITWMKQNTDEATLEMLFRKMAANCANVNWDLMKNMLKIMLNDDRTPHSKSNIHTISCDPQAQKPVQLPSYSTEDVHQVAVDQGPGKRLFSSYYTPERASAEEQKLWASVTDSSGEPLLRSGTGNFIQIQQKTLPVIHMKVLSECSDSVCHITWPTGSGSGFRVGPHSDSQPCYIMTAKHVLDAILQEAIRPIGSNRLDPLVDSNVYAEFGYLMDGHQNQDKTFYFKSSVHFEDKETDCAILELVPKAGMPKPFTCFSVPKLEGGFHLIGHSKGEPKATNSVDHIIDLTSQQTKQDIVTVREWSKQTHKKDYELAVTDDVVTNESRFLFHCCFTKGASGCPGIIVQSHTRAVVVTMLLHGYPDWYYNPMLAPEEKEAVPYTYCVEQGASMMAIYNNMNSQGKRRLCTEIFGARDTSIQT